MKTSLYRQENRESSRNPAEIEREEIRRALRNAGLDEETATELAHTPGLELEDVPALAELAEQKARENAAGLLVRMIQTGRQHNPRGSSEPTTPQAASRLGRETETQTQPSAANAEHELARDWWNSLPAQRRAELIEQHNRSAVATCYQIHDYRERHLPMVVKELYHLAACG